MDAAENDTGRPGHAPSYYAATANDRSIRPALRGEVATDVCIVGAGFTGISAGLELAERGFSVVVLEAVRIGFGASGRNGGQIVNGYSRDLAIIERRYGAEKARALGAMSLEGGNIIRDRVARYAIACDLRAGNFLAAFTGKQLREMEETKHNWESHGHTGLELIDRTGVAGIVDTDRYAGGMVDHLGGHIHPLNLVLGEAAALETLGGRIYERSPATAVETGPSPLVRTRDGVVRARYVLVCGNAYLGRLLPEIGGKIMPVSSQIIATEPLEPALARRLLPAGYCVEDASYVLDYFRRTADDRLLYGGGVGYGGSDPHSIVGAIRPNMLKTFPALRDTRIDFAWSGNFALTLTRVPHVGRLSPTVYFSHGDSGHGVTTTHLLGKLLGEAVAGHAERFDVWASLPYYPFPGGHSFSVPLTVMGSWWYRLRDRLGV
ncbi:MAG: FAD-binding oxidoreductase [Devosia sp.]|nr:FAD-binding oxidoreductase [Devosia sp.]